MPDVRAFLSSHGIQFEWFDHPAVFTCEEAKELLPDMPGTDTKNLFLRDKSGKRHFIVSVGHDARVDIRALQKLIDAKDLSFGSPERLREYLSVEPGSVTLIGLMNDPDKKVEVIIDQAIWDADAIRCHPLVNTASIIISHEGLEKFLHVTGHEPCVISVPARPTE